MRVVSPGELHPSGADSGEQTEEMSFPRAAIARRGDSGEHAAIKNQHPTRHQQVRSRPGETGKGDQPAEKKIPIMAEER